jgi:uncharacterized protein
MKIIALEEHFITPDMASAWHRLDPQWQDLALRATQGDMGRSLLDLGAQRIAAMDDAGIDVQVLSALPPGVQNLAADVAVALQVDLNDLVAETVRTNPDRFQGLATLATPDPEAAARELERAVTKLGMNGAMLYGRTRDQNADHTEYWPIYEAAAALNVPLYLHPQTPPPAVRTAYYEGYSPAINAGLATFAIGWHYDAGMQLLRLIVSGVFDRFPNLQIISGHWGEVVLFYIERLEKFAKEAGLPRSIEHYFRTNVLVTPGGILSQRYLRWAIEVMGIDRILFAVDYPFEPVGSGAARRFLEQAPLSKIDREKIAFRNWNHVCAAIKR